MNSKQQAKDIFNEYWMYLRANLLHDDEAKEDARVCSLLCVNRILNECYEVKKPFWLEVKKELEKNEF